MQSNANIQCTCNFLHATVCTCNVTHACALVHSYCASTYMCAHGGDAYMQCALFQGSYEAWCTPGYTRCPQTRTTTPIFSCSISTGEVPPPPPPPACMQYVCIYTVHVVACTVQYIQCTLSSSGNEQCTSKARHTRGDILPTCRMQLE